MNKGPRRVNISKQQRARARAERQRRPRGEIVAGRKRRSRGVEGPSLESLAGASIAFPFGYLAVEGIMNDNQHPIHWIVAFFAGVIGLVAGQAFYWWKQQH